MKKLFGKMLVLAGLLTICFGMNVFASEVDTSEEEAVISESMESYSYSAVVSLNHWYSNTLFLAGDAHVDVEYVETSYGIFTSKPYVDNMVIYGDGYTTTYTQRVYFTSYNGSTSSYYWDFYVQKTRYRVYLNVDEYGDVSVSYIPYTEQ